MAISVRIILKFLKKSLTFSPAYSVVFAVIAASSPKSIEFFVEINAIQRSAGAVCNLYFVSLSPLRKVIIYKNLRFLFFVLKLDVLIIN